MAKLLHPLLLLVAQATEKERVRMVEYLKAENRILRSKLPKRIEVTPVEPSKFVFSPAITGTQSAPRYA